jgi:hypothetical protein
MRVLRWSTLAAAVLAISVYASPVYADSIGPNCGSCFGGIWTLEFQAHTGGTPTDYDIFFTVDTSGMSSATFGDLSHIGFKVADAIVSASLVTPPTGTNWGFNAQINTGVNDNGCSGGGSGFVCSDAVTDIALPATPNATLTWQFLVDIGANALLTGPLAASIKATGVSVNGQVVSEGITLQPIPEPTTLLLVGTMLAGVGIWSRKRWLERNAA